MLVRCGDTGEVDETEASYARVIAGLDRCVEWHLDFHNTFGHEEFHFGARPHQPAVVIAAMFFYSGLEAIRSIRYLMRGDGIE